MHAMEFLVSFQSDQLTWSTLWTTHVCWNLKQKKTHALHISCYIQSYNH